MRREAVLSVLSEHKKEIEKKFGVKRIGIFGSVARDEAEKDSDVDVVVETTEPNLFMMVDLKDELERMLGARVDLIRYWRR
ncbi:MAG: nucleotidyltransferase, partial [Dehalococcoidia bacterium]